MRKLLQTRPLERPNSSRHQESARLRGNGIMGVRFQLFGGFEAIRDGQTVVLPKKTAGAYLWLLLLSGKPFLDNGDGVKLGTNDGIRTLVDKANLPPALGRFGRYDFKGETGLELRFRVGTGLILEGDWTSDVQELDRAWQSRGSASEEELCRVLERVGQGPDLRHAPKESVVKDCWDWVTDRVSELESRKRDIETELKVRERLEGVGSRQQRGYGSEGLKHERGVSVETSGSEDAEESIIDASSDSTPLGDELREVELGGSLESEVATPGSDPTSSVPGGEREGERDESLGDVSEEKAAEQFHIEGGSMSGEGKRSVTALGVLAVAVLAGFLFASGYVVAVLLAPAADQGDSESTSRTTQPPVEDLTAIDSEPSNALDDPEYFVRAPENPKSLHDLFLQRLEGWFSKKEGEVVIARQLFNSHMRAFGGGGDPVTVVFKLDREFSTLKCVIGVPDADIELFVPESAQVSFEGDGRVLKKVDVSPSSARLVEVDVSDIKALIISFRRPVVIAEPVVWR